jgi:indolepyruvate ferredoxin oxidoreductase
VVNTHEMMTGEFTRNADFSLPAAALRQAIERTAGQRAHFVPATRLASALLGDAIATNLFMVGFAYQEGLLPVSAAAIERAIEINRVAVGMNQSAFRWGRRAALDLAAVEAAAKPTAVSETRLSQTLDELIERRVAHLTDYQDAAYAARYQKLVERVRAADAALGGSALSEAIARYYAKLLAYKDEYEVARLYTDGAFMAEIDRRFAGTPKLALHLAPPLLAQRDLATGHLKKRAYGPWIFTALKYLARMRSLRGRWLDPFGHSAERRAERRLIADYERTVEELLARLSAENYGLAVEIAQIPEQIRGYGHVKQRHLAVAKRREAELLAAFRAPPAGLTNAA